MTYVYKALLFLIVLVTRSVYSILKLSTAFGLLEISSIEHMYCKIVVMLYITLHLTTFSRLTSAILNSDVLKVTL